MLVRVTLPRRIASHSPFARALKGGRVGLGFRVVPCAPLAERLRRRCTRRRSRGGRWDKEVVIYGGATLRDDNPVMAFLLAEAKVKTIYVLIGGFTSFEAKYGFLCTGSVRGEPKK